MSVSAIIVTRGDVDLSPVLESLPQEWEVLVWDNGRKLVTRWTDREPYIVEEACENLAVYGRYAAIEHASNEIIYVQDDDCVLSDPRAVVEGLRDAYSVHGGMRRGFVCCNMPANFRHSFYEEHSLVGFGAVFHRDAPARAFDRFFRSMGASMPDDMPHALAQAAHFGFGDAEGFLRTCDIVFTTLTPRVLVDVPYEDLPWASAENRMWKQPTHREERGRMLDLVKQVRDA